MPLSSVTTHVVTPLTLAHNREVVEGEPVSATERGRAFLAALFLPSSQQQDRRGRQVTRPTLIWEPVQDDDAGEFVALLRSGERVGIVAAEQNEVAGRTEDLELEWVVDGDPQPLGRPGSEPKALLATVRRVED